MNQLIRLHLVVSTIFLLLCSWLPGKTQRLFGAQETIEQYFSSIDEIKTLQYSGELTGRVAKTPAGILRKHTRKFSASENFRVLEVLHEPENFQGAIEDSHSIVIMESGKSEVFYPINRVAEITKKFASLETNSKLDYTFFEIYMVSIGWMPESNSAIVNECLAQKWPAWVIRKSERSLILEASDGVQDDLTISDYFSDDGYCRVWCWRSKKGAPQKIEQIRNEGHRTDRTTYIFDDYKLAKNGIWLPHEITKETCSKTGTSGWIQHYFMKLRVADLRINETVIDQASVHLPGSILIDFDTGLQRVLPGGFELLDRSVEFVSDKLSQKNLENQFGSYKFFVGIGLLSVFPIWFITKSAFSTFKLKKFALCFEKSAANFNLDRE